MLLLAALVLVMLCPVRGAESMQFVHLWIIYAASCFQSCGLLHKLCRGSGHCAYAFTVTVASILHIPYLQAPLCVHATRH